MASIQALPGTRDILPDKIGYWQRLEAVARDVLAKAAYTEIRTPIFEATELFARGIGETTDVVGKEMYSFVDRGDRSCTLRPEGTAGAVRAYIEQGLAAQGGVQRLWYLGPMFRYERPQAGRQRQFHQLGVELLGCGAARADVEALAIATDILMQLGLKQLSFQVNSLGDAGDRGRYRDALVDYLTPYKSELDPDSQNRLDRNPLRILDSKNQRTQEILQGAPNLLEQLSPESRSRFDQVQRLLDQLGIVYEVNPRLVRGLDYYTHTVFEIQSADLGAQATVCGGGRYDGLVGQLGGPETPAVGWAMGLERLLVLLEQLAPIAPANVDLYIVSKGTAAEDHALILAQRLRQVGLTVEMDLSGSAFGKQFKRADRSGAAACLILGDAEAESQTVQMKWMQSGEQNALSQAELLATVADWRSRLNTRS